MVKHAFFMVCYAISDGYAHHSSSFPMLNGEDGEEYEMEQVATALQAGETLPWTKTVPVDRW